MKIRSQELKSVRAHSRHRRRVAFELRPQQPGVLFQPLLGRAIIGAHRFHLAPESRRMVHLPEMHQFVENDVIAHERRRLDEPPVERDRSAPGTRTPARALIAHGHAAHGQLKTGREFHHAQRQFPLRQPAQMSFDGWPQVARRICHGQLFRAEANHSARRYLRLPVGQVRRGITPPNPAAIPAVSEAGRAGVSVALRARRDSGWRNAGLRKPSRRAEPSPAPCHRGGAAAHNAAPGHCGPAATERVCRPPPAILRAPAGSGN